MLANFDELFIGETIIAWPPPLVEERMMPGTSLLAVFSALNIPEWHCFCMNDQIDVYYYYRYALLTILEKVKNH